MFRRVINLLSAKLSTNVFTVQTQALNNILGLSQNLPKNLARSVPFSSLQSSVSKIIWPFQGISRNSNNLLLGSKQILVEQNRTLVKFSWQKGSRKSVKVVPRKFFRLHWGIWIRTIAGRHKKLWKKSRSQRNRLEQHVFCNATQSKMLDTMVSKYWRQPKYYIEDPYENYHKREEFYITRRKPWRPEGCDYE